MLPDLPQFDPVAVPELAYYVWGILFFSLFARAWFPEWKRAAKTQNDNGTPPEPPRSRR